MRNAKPGNHLKRAHHRMRHREHTILLSRERVNKGTKRMNSLRLPPHLISSILREFTGKTTAYKTCVKARLHKRFLSRQLDAIFVALELQLQNHTCKLGAISVRFVAAISHGVSNMFKTCCNNSATKIASSCRDKNRLCKRALTL